MGGCVGGLKVGRFTKNAGITVEKLVLSPQVLGLLNQRFVLVYTGRTRLAKNVLQVSDFALKYFHGFPGSDPKMVLA